MSDANPNANPNTRKEKRTPVTLKIKFKSATLDQFIERYSVDVSHGGIFIRTKDPLGVGTQLKFEFQLQDASPLISGEGTVVWTREHDPNRVGVAPGMGVRFDRLSAESRQVLERILAQKGSRDATLEPKFETAGNTALVPPSQMNALMARSAPAPGAKPATPFNGQNKVDEDFDDGVFEQPTKVAALKDVMKQRKEEEADPSEAPTLSKGTPAPAAPKWIDAQRMSTMHGVGPVGPMGPQPKSPAPLPGMPMGTPPAGTPPPAAAPTGDEPTMVAPASARPQLSVVKDEGPDAAADPMEATQAAPPPEAMSEGEPATSDERHRPTMAVEPLPPPEKDQLPAHAREAPEADTPRKRSSATFVLIGVVGVLAAAGILFMMNRTEEQRQARPTTAAGSPEAATPAPTPPPAQPPEPVPSEATPAAAPAPAAAAVQVAVSTDPPGATVALDGVAHGQPTPATLSLEPGKKAKITVERACFGTQTVEVDTGAAKPVEPIHVKLKPLPRILDVQTTPRGAIVVLDGRALGPGPRQVRLQGDPLKAHTVTARKPGFAPAEQTIGADTACASADGKLGKVTVALTLEKAAAPVAATPRPTPEKPAEAKPAEKPPVESAARPAEPAPAEKPAEKPAAAAAPTPPPEAKETPAAKPKPAKPAKPPAAEPPRETPPKAEPPKEEPPKEAPPAEEHVPDWMK